MGVRADKGKAVARYILGHTGIPGVAFAGSTNDIIMPLPYFADVTTARKLQLWHDRIAAPAGEGSLSHNIAIRYDNNMASVADAWVGMTLHQFVPLLTAHYDHVVRPRIERMEK